MALNVPPTAVLCGYMEVCGYLLSPAVIEVCDKDWVEPVILWITICMPTGSGKSTLFRHLMDLLEKIKKECGVTEDDPSWIFDDASFEKMGALMAANSCRLFGFYDELSAFLSQINLYRGKGLLDTHEMAVFLQLYNGQHWRRETISGDANFAMPSTYLTVGGFTQPSVARHVIELSSSSEKGFTHRFMWMFPKPLFQRFAKLETVNEDFIENLTQMLARQYSRPQQKGASLPNRVFQLKPPYEGFHEYYDEVQDYLEKIAGMDEIISGLLSKSRGQVLRVAAVFQVLFSVDPQRDTASEEDDIIQKNCIIASINFVKTACQHALYIAGKGNLEEEVLIQNTVTETEDDDNDANESDKSTDDKANAGFCLTLPGRKLYIQPLLFMKKFKNRGNKRGAVKAIILLEQEGLGRVIQIRSSKSSVMHYEFEKCLVPQEVEQRLIFAKKLSGFGISLPQYERHLQEQEILPLSLIGAKRKAEVMEEPTTPRRSPRKN